MQRDQRIPRNSGFDDQEEGEGENAGEKKGEHERRRPGRGGTAKFETKEKEGGAGRECEEAWPVEEGKPFQEGSMGSMETE